MIAKVVVDIANGEVDKTFDYLVPEEMIIAKGDRVIVPFGPKKSEGFCIELNESSDVTSLKRIESVEKGFLKPEFLALLDFMRAKFYLRYADVLRLFIPPGMRGGRSREIERLQVSLVEGLDFDDIAAAVSPRAKRRLAAAEALMSGPRFLVDLGEEFGVQAVNALIADGLAVKRAVKVERTPFALEYGEKKSVTLTSAQRIALDAIFSDGRTVSLLHGVTGSGKTEVYMSAIEKVIAEGKTAIMLVPEISLTPQTMRSFRARFGDTVALLHSGLSDGERLDEWFRLSEGRAKIALGARSAVFAPLENVGIIIIDEEHDASYVSQSNPRYRTSDVAFFRARYNGAKLILGSATPSIETYDTAKKGEYALLNLPERVSGNPMPAIHIVDMSAELIGGNGGIFSAELTRALKQALGRGEQAMLFLNRRGHSSFVMCKKCGYIAKCGDCDVSLTYHRTENQLKCHYCGKRYLMLDRCPACGDERIRYGKVGTERVVEELRKLMPNVKTLRLDNDTTSTKTAYLEILGAFGRGEAQVLVGTQMIAKGHDFPDVTVVGILDADISLYTADYRSNERTFQLVTQVAGRAGRADKQGEVYLQTYSPKHYVYSFARAYDYEGFYAKEIAVRSVTDFPPFATIVRVLISGPDESKVIDCAKHLYAAARELCARYEKDFIYLQAMKAPITRIQNKYRYQIIARIRRAREDEIIGEIYGIIGNNAARKVSIFAEVNPQNMS